MRSPMRREQTQTNQTVRRENEVSEARFYLITIRPDEGVTDAQLEKKMNAALDWYRYSTGCWVVWSTSDLIRWKERLMPLVQSSGALFIAALTEGEYGGWANKGLWDFLRRHR